MSQQIDTTNPTMIPTPIRYTRQCVQLLVGPSEDASYANEGRLRASSRFFDTLMNEEWKQYGDRVIRLPDYDSKIFSIYCHWLHNGDKTLLVGGEDIEAQHIDLAEAYVLGIRLVDLKFQNKLIDSIAVLGRHWTSWWAISYLYMNTVPGDPVRRLLVDMCAIKCEENRIPHLANFVPFEFRDDLRNKLDFLRDIRDSPNAMKRLRLAESESRNYHHQVQNQIAVLEDIEEQDLVCVGSRLLHLDQ